ncbi:MAG: hypothetical protein WB774_05245, partial [Xanthobacteraceae bacterium]
MVSASEQASGLQLKMRVALPVPLVRIRRFGGDAYAAWLSGTGQAPGDGVELVPGDTGLVASGAGFAGFTAPTFGAAGFAVSPPAVCARGRPNQGRNCDQDRRNDEAFH